VFAINPNLLPELGRRNIVPYRRGQAEIDASALFHEGKLLWLAHDKSAQQDIAVGTGVTPIRHAAAMSREECLEVVKAFHREGLAAVLKMNAGSGGTGIRFCPPWFDDNAISKEIDQLVLEASEKYGKMRSRHYFPCGYLSLYVALVAQPEMENTCGICGSRL